MSYTTGFGDTASWLGLLANTDEVYLLRVRATDFAPKSPLDMLEIVRAVGGAPMGGQTAIDVRGIGLWTDPSSLSGDQTIDVIFTSPTSGIALSVPSASSIVNSLNADTVLRKIFPGAVFHDGSLLQLTGPMDAIDTWRSQPVLWDHSLQGPTGRGGPTDTFATPADYSVVLGKADDGKQAKPWKVNRPGLGPGPGSSPSSGTLLWLGVAAAAAIGIAVMKGRKR
jgi:hypothetical protein